MQFVSISYSNSWIEIIPSIPKQQVLYPLKNARAIFKPVYPETKPGMNMDEYVIIYPVEKYMYVHRL